MECEEVVALLYTVIDMVGCERVKYVTVGMEGYQKAKVSRTEKGKIKIERETAEKRKFEE